MAENTSSKPPTEGRHSPSARRYITTRFTSLLPAFDEGRNPIRALRLLNRRHWLFFLVAFLGWTWDAFDYFTIPLTISDLAATFSKSNADITWGITLVLMFRPVGAAIFGIVSDRYGRKWPFIVNLFLFVVLELATGFCRTYPQFLAVRALFGLAMGGLYGNAAATALEECPFEARGIISGILQQGYSFGYLLATAFARGLVNTTSHGWRPLFWFGACPPVLIIAFRMYLPETTPYLEHEKTRKQNKSATSSFIAEGALAFERHWLMLTYMVFLMAGFNFMSHGTQDLYPTMLTNQYNFSATQLTVTQVVANVGAILGGVVAGEASQIFGRRFTIILFSIAGGALLYPYTYTSNGAITAAAFFEQFCVQGAWGVVPIHLMEMAPRAIRTFAVGTTYQLGNLASSASAMIEARLSERFPLPPGPKGHKRFQYGKVICIFTGCVYVYVILLTFIGPEYRNRNMDDDSDSYAESEAPGVTPASTPREEKEQV